jgi:hypothetical protein
MELSFVLAKIEPIISMAKGVVKLPTIVMPSRITVGGRIPVKNSTKPM